MEKKWETWRGEIDKTLVPLLRRLPTNLMMMGNRLMSEGQKITFWGSWPPSASCLASFSCSFSWLVCCCQSHPFPVWSSSSSCKPNRVRAKRVINAGCFEEKNGSGYKKNQTTCVKHTNKGVEHKCWPHTKLTPPQTRPHLNIGGVCRHCKLCV